jgi:signal peptidase I
MASDPPAHGSPRGPSKPNRLTAATLALFCTGIGVLYAGAAFRSACWVLAAWGWPLVASLLLSLSDTRATRLGTATALVTGIIVIRVACVMDAWRTASLQLAPLRYFQRLPVIAVIAMAYLAVGWLTRQTFFSYSPMLVARVAGSSMVPTMFDGERVAVSRISSVPERGAIVRYAPPDLPRRRYLGRLVALPGDEIEGVDGRLLVNGRSEQYWTYGLGRLVTDTEREALATTTDIPRQSIDEDCVFVLGDNRANSRDSRHFGCVPLDHVLGRVEWWIIRMQANGHID